jgi:hypothetical protein
MGILVQPNLARVDWRRAQRIEVKNFSGLEFRRTASGATVRIIFKGVVAFLLFN